eukprot:3789141-Rhodomonas_salina.1
MPGISPVAELLADIDGLREVGVGVKSEADQNNDAKYERADQVGGSVQDSLHDEAAAASAKKVEDSCATDLEQVQEQGWRPLDCGHGGNAGRVFQVGRACDAGGKHRGRRGAVREYHVGFEDVLDLKWELLDHGDDGVSEGKQQVQQAHEPQQVLARREQLPLRLALPPRAQGHPIFQSEIRRPQYRSVPFPDAVRVGRELWVRVAALRVACRRSPDGRDRLVVDAVGENVIGVGVDGHAVEEQQAEGDQRGENQRSLIQPRFVADQEAARRVSADEEQMLDQPSDLVQPPDESFGLLLWVVPGHVEHRIFRHFAEPFPERQLPHVVADPEVHHLH